VAAASRGYLKSFSNASIIKPTKKSPRLQKPWGFTDLPEKPEKT
jgi:hypothetical protein